MLNYHELRGEYSAARNDFGIPTRMAQKRSKTPLYALILVIMTAVLLLGMSGCAWSKTHIDDKSAILAIIGEGEGENFNGKVALAATIYNRGNLRGVFGLNSARVRNHLYSDMTYDDAKRAWAFIKLNGPGDWVATGWGNAQDIKSFKRTKWFKRCILVAHIGNHFFYRVKQKGE